MQSFFAHGGHLTGLMTCVLQFQLVSPPSERHGGPLSYSLWHPHLYEFTFDLSSGEMTRDALAPGLSSDMPAIDRSLSGACRPDCASERAAMSQGPTHPSASVDDWTLSQSHHRSSMVGAAMAKVCAGVMPMAFP